MRKTTKLYTEKTIKELEKQESVLRQEIAKAELSRKTAPVKDTNMIFKKRKELAVLLTVLSEKRTTETIKNK